MKSKRKTSIPSKKIINLAFKEEKEFSLKRTIPSLLGISILALLFSNYAVLGRINKVRDLNRQADDLETAVTVLEAAVQNYDALSEEYSKYAAAQLTEAEKDLVSRSKIFDLIETELMPYCDVRSVTGSGNSITIQLGSITLDKASQLIRAIDGKDFVDHVAVFSADTTKETGRLAAIQMMITLKPQEGGLQ